MADPLAELANAYLSQALGARKRIAEDDPYLEAQGIPESLFGTIIQGAPKYGTGQSAKAGILTGLASGLLGGLSKDYQNRAEDAYLDVLGQAYTGQSPERPDVLSPSLFGTAQNQARAAKTGALFKQLFSRGDAEAEIQRAKDLEKAKIQGTLEAYGLSSPGGTGLQSFPDSPQFKITKELEDRTKALRDEFQKSPQFSEYQLSEKGYRSLLNAIDDSSPTSDLELIRGAIQAIEPGLAVREGEAAAVENSASIPQKWKAQISKALSGESGLDPAVREGILRIAKRRYDEQARVFKTAKDFYQKEATRLKLPEPSAVTYYGDIKTAIDLEKEIRGKTKETEPTKSTLDTRKQLENILSTLRESGDKMSDSEKQLLIKKAEALATK